MAKRNISFHGMQDLLVSVNAGAWIDYLLVKPLIFKTPVLSSLDCSAELTILYLTSHPTVGLSGKLCKCEDVLNIDVCKFAVMHVDIKMTSVKCQLYIIVLRV